MKEPSVEETSAGPPFANLLLGMGIAGLTFLVYCRCLDHPFLNYDDQLYVFRNPHVLAGLTRDSISWAFTTFHFANWHPLTWLSLQLDCTLYGGAKPAGFHFTNLVLHVINALLLFTILCRFTGRTWPSALAAALFALHPQQVEAVAWVSERKGLLSSLCWMLALAGYGSYVRRPGAGRYLVVALALALGLMAKGMVVTLPCVLLLLDYWPLGRWPRVSARRLVLEKVPLFALVIAGSVLAFLAQQHGQAVATLEEFSLAERLGNAVLAYVGYLGHLLWPVELAVYYPHTRSTISLPTLLSAGGFLVAVTVLVLAGRRRWPYLPVGWFWYLGTLVPVIGLVQLNEQAMADRYGYLPAIGLFMLLSWGAADLLRVSRLPRPTSFVVTAALLGLCAWRTWMQAGYWASDLALWQHTAAVTRENAATCISLGNVLYNLGQRRQALEQYEKAVRLPASHGNAHYHLGLVLMDLDRTDEGVAELLQVRATDPAYRLARVRLGQFAYQEGLLDLARRQFEEVVALDPDSAASRMDLGIVLRELDRQEDARGEFQAAVRLDPGNGQARAELAQDLIELGHYDEALAELREALDRLPPDHPWRGPLARMLRQGERLQSLERQLPALLETRSWPTTVSDQLALAELCGRSRWRRHAAAAKLYAEAFASPQPAGPSREQHRYAAVVAAVRAGTGQDALPLDATELRRWREQAREWVHADLALCRSQADQEARRRLRRWQQDQALAALREPAALAQWPAEEQQDWRQLWRDLDSLFAQDGARARAAERLFAAETAR